MNHWKQVVLTGLIVLSALGVPLGGAQAKQAFPDVIPLPDGFRPEGIALGKGHTFYVGSLANGAIYQVDLRTGEGSLLVEGQAGRMAVGLAFDERSQYLFVSGGATGQAIVYDTRSGAEVGFYQLTEEQSFINDADVTREAAYFTNSFAPVLYRLPLGPDGSLPDMTEVEMLPLTGEWEQVPGAFNANGIVATADGQSLIVVNSTLGALFRVDPLTGEATRIELAGGDVTAGDGLVLRGRTLYVVQNQLNQVAVVILARDLTSAKITRVITDPNLDIPTTGVFFGKALYLVNARFTTPPAPDTEYNVIRVSVK
jgi:sugar lactone lactonase YvrE